MSVRGKELHGDGLFLVVASAAWQSCMEYDFVIARNEVTWQSHNIMKCKKNIFFKRLPRCARNDKNEGISNLTEVKGNV